MGRRDVVTRRDFLTLLPGLPITASRHHLSWVDLTPIPLEERSAQEGVLDVKAFGAQGNGESDDAAAVQAAIDHAQDQAYGGIVYFPPGDYLIGNTVIVQGAPLSLDGMHRGRIALLGAGRNISRVIAGKSLAPGAAMFAVGSGVSSRRLKEFWVEHVWLDGGARAVDLMRLAWVSRSSMRSVLFRNTAGHGLHVRGGHDLHFYDVFWEKCGGDGSHFGFLCDGRDTSENVNNLWFVGCRWENTFSNPGGGLLRIDGSGMSSRSGKHRFVACKFHGMPQTSQRTDQPHVSLVACKQTHFVACEYSKTNGEFVELIDCDSIHFMGGETSGGGSDNGHHFNLVNAREISFEAVSFYDAQTAFVKLDSACRNVYIAPTCTYGRPNGEASLEDPNQRGWLCDQQDNTLHQFGRVVHPVQILHDGDAHPDVTSGHLFQTNNSAPATIVGFRGGVVGQRIIIQAADSNTRIQHGVNIFLKDNSTRKLYARETLDLVCFAQDRWYEV